MPSTRRVLEHVTVAHAVSDSKRSKANKEIIVASKVTASREDWRRKRSNRGDVIVPPKETLLANVLNGGLSNRSKLLNKIIENRKGTDSVAGSSCESDNGVFDSVADSSSESDSGSVTDCDSSSKVGSKSDAQTTSSTSKNPTTLETATARNAQLVNKQLRLSLSSDNKSKENKQLRLLLDNQSKENKQLRTS